MIENCEPPDVGFETFSAIQWGFKRALVNPLANYLPSGLTKAILRFGKSELAEANWADPGGWRSMVISYNGRCGQLADKILVKAGTVPTALRNRKRLAAHLIAGLIDDDKSESTHVLCLGAGPGQIIIEAMSQAKTGSHATLVDLNTGSFDFGRALAARQGLEDRVRFIQADVRDLHEYLHDMPHIVKMLGICEYLDDEQIVTIAGAAWDVMPDGAPIVFNSISKSHGTDRFFRRVFGLHMNHRSPGELAGLMKRAGFGSFVTYREPLGVYHVIIGRKVRPEN
ncbi:MAG: class I SAM-dependent methyltransferase family protein [Planctomycetota bacterium]|nr:class I SAM-dependent methyltransferase family protein [Planctomycetota bacterium]